MTAHVVSAPTPRIPWIWEVVPGYNEAKGYRWIMTNVVMHNDDTGVTIRYRPRRVETDVICGARTTHPGYTHAAPPYDGPWEAVCNIVGDHAEMPHVGVPAACADMKCDCWRRGSYHLVIVGIGLDS